MYNKNIRIRFCSDDDQLLRSLQAEAVPPYCRVDFCKEDENLECDLCLIDLDKVQFFKQEQKLKFKEPMVVLFKSLEKISAECWNNFYDCWRIDDNYVEILHRYNLLLCCFELKHERDLEHKYLETIIDNSSALIWIKDKEGRHLEVNQSFCRAVGKTREQIRGRGHYYIWDMDYAEYERGEYVCVETDQTVMEQASAGTFDETVKTKQGMRRFRTAKAPIFDDGGQVVGTVGIASDVTDVLNLSTEIQTVIDQMPFGVMLYDDQGIIRNCNRRFRDLIGGMAEHNVDVTVEDVHQKLLNNGWQEKILESGQHELSVQNTEHRGWYVVSKSDLQDVFGNKLGHLLTFEDVTLERLRSQTFEMQAMTDALTGIGNRRYFFFQVHKMRGANHSDGVLFIDLNKFKQLNDSYGHEAGDAALIEIAKIMKRIFPGNDAVLSRYGGDEFVIYVKDSEEYKLQELSLQLAEEIRKAFEDHSMKGLTASVGVVYNKADGHHLDALINTADSCMYEAKKRGIPVYYLSLAS